MVCILERVKYDKTLGRCRWLWVFELKESVEHEVEDGDSTDRRKDERVPVDEVYDLVDHWFS